MGQQPTQSRDWADITTYVVMFGGLLVAIVTAAGRFLNIWHPLDVTVTIATAVAFTMAMVRLIAAAVVRRRHRLSQLSLLTAMLLWGVGSLSIASGHSTTHADFPSPVEALFLGACIGLAGHVMLDRQHVKQVGRKSFIDATILAAGASVTAGLVLFNPFVDVLGGRHGAQLLALIYPLFDLMLMALVALQILARVRPRDIASLGTVVGFAALFLADIFLISAATSKAYDYGELPTVLWSLAWILLVESSIHSSSLSGDVRLPGHYGGYGVSAAALAAIAVLILRPGDRLGVLLVVMATVTLLLVGLRLLIALREANTAADAVRLALTDDLTGLPNRRAVFKELDRATREGAPIGVLMIDLDGFKEVNDSLGHAVGDDLLKTVASRIGKVVTRGSIARLGGDEFFIQIGSADSGFLLNLAMEIRSAVRKPFRIDGLDLMIDASIGITTSESADRPSDFLRQSDIAMYHAKHERLGACVYDAQSDTFGWERLHILAELRDSIEKRQLEVWFQPKVNAYDGSVGGVEALVRWRSGDSLVPPNTFLPIARRAGLMGDLSLCVVDIVLNNLVRWRDLGIELPVAVNIAPAELLNGPVLGHLFHELSRLGLPGSSVLIEITEDSFISDPERARVVISEIHAHGIGVSLDDYGSGFSSLAHLKEINAQELKVDQSFIAAIVTDARSRTIVGTTFQMARGLGMRTVAEGVENEETAEDLRRLGVDVLQGFHLARPMPPTDLLNWLEGRRVGASTVPWHRGQEPPRTPVRGDSPLLRPGR